jgi:tetratricopeptide (TPR) repeat protein
LPRARVVFLLLAVAVCAAFAPALRHDFVGYDDPDYVTQNPHVSTGLTAANLRWALTAAHASNWHPLTWVSHMLDVTLFGLDPAGHHLTSLLLHVANTLLLFALLRRDTTGAGPSAFVATVFGLHPLHVESVAWVAERKDVLSTFFWLLALLAYGAYTRRPDVRRYGIVLLLFAAGLAAKPMVVTLPLTLLLWDVWPLQRQKGASARRLVAEKVPLLALAALSGLVTLWAQRRGASLVGIDALPFGARLANAAVAYVRYLGKTFWPSGLAAFYPPTAWSATAVILSATLMVAVTSLAWRERRRRPWIAVGWTWYAVTLLPVIGLIQVGQQAMADRYMYVPMIGLLVAIAWTLAEVAPSRPLAAAAVALGVALAVATWRQVHVWRDGVALWTHALAVTDGNFIAHDNLGVELDRRGRADEALEHYRATLRLKPGDRNGTRNYAAAVAARGERLYRDGQRDAALAAFRDALQHRPDDARVQAYAGAILVTQGRYEEALAAYDAALAVDPRAAAVHADRAVVLHALGRDAEARMAIEAARARGVEPVPELIESLRRRAEASRSD